MNIFKEADIITYRVTGRYMNGSSVEAYHIIGTDGSQSKITKERLIRLIKKKLVSNMRVQYNNEEVIIRGKGIRINDLPVYNCKRDTNCMKIITMKQVTITKRILSKTKCLGYVVTDCTGNEMRLHRDKVMELAKQKLVSNAKVQSYKTNNKETQVLRGVGCSLMELPIIIIDEASEEEKCTWFTNSLNR